MAKSGTAICYTFLSPLRIPTFHAYDLCHLAGLVTCWPRINLLKTAKLLLIIFSTMSYMCSCTLGFYTPPIIIKLDIAIINVQNILNDKDNIFI